MPVFFLNNDGAGPGTDAPVSSCGAASTHVEARAAAVENEDCGPSAVPVIRRRPDPSHRRFAWSVAAGLALLVAWLAAVLASAGLSVEVLP